MNIHELQIGSILLYDKKMKKINTNDLEICLYKNDIFNDLYKPIKITEDLLHQLFEFDNKTDCFEASDFTINFSTKDFWIVPVSGREIKCKLPVYLHQFQMILFSHTGVMFEL